MGCSHVSHVPFLTLSVVTCAAVMSLKVVAPVVKNDLFDCETVDCSLGKMEKSVTLTNGKVSFQWYLGRHPLGHMKKCDQTCVSSKTNCWSYFSMSPNSHGMIGPWLVDG